MKNMMRWKKERTGSSCLQWHRHTHAERERPTHTTLTHSHAQPEGGEEKKEDKTRLSSKCGGTARGGCDSFAGRSMHRQQGRGEGTEAPSPLPVDQVGAKGVCVSV